MYIHICTYMYFCMYACELILHHLHLKFHFLVKVFNGPRHQLLLLEFFTHLFYSLCNYYYYHSKVIKSLLMLLLLFLWLRLVIH